MCIGRDHQDDRGWPEWRWCRTTSTPTGCHGPTQSTWPRTDHSGGCWQQWRYALVVVQAREEEKNIELRHIDMEYREKYQQRISTKNDTVVENRKWLTTAQLHRIQSRPDLAVEQSTYNLDSEMSICHNSQSSKPLSQVSTTVAGTILLHMPKRFDLERRNLVW